jgi:hypothetical protein
MPLWGPTEWAQREFGVSYATIAHAAKRTGIKFKRPRWAKVFNYPRGEQMRNLYCKGETLQQIGDCFGISTKCSRLPEVLLGCARRSLGVSP